MSILASVCARTGGRLSVVLLVAMCGCATREPLVDRTTDSPPPFSESGQQITPDRWWTEFGDPYLNQQVNQAFRGSFTLSAAIQRLFAARAITRREASDLWPDIDGLADVGGFFGPGRDRGVYTWGLDASYQVDLWGQIESRVDAERLRAAATRADYHAVALTLSAEVARTWFSLIEAHAQIELLDDQIRTNQEGLERQETASAQGQIRAPDLFRQSQLVESTKEQKVIVQAQIEVLEHRLAVLLGQPAQQVSYETGTDLPELPPLPATGLPCDLLNRRPDVRRDFLEFAAADRDVAVAITDQFPRLNLAGSLLNVADRPETLFRDWFVTIGGQLIGPIVDGGERRAEVDRTSAVLRLRFDEYGDTVVNAFREVEDALALERYQLERIEYLERQLELARLSTPLLLDYYSLEIVDYLNYLQAVTTEQRLQRETLSARLELLQIRISLYLALAGGFNPCQPEFLGFQDAPLLIEESDLDSDGTSVVREVAPLDLADEADPQVLPVPVPVPGGSRSDLPESTILEADELNLELDVLNSPLGTETDE